MRRKEKEIKDIKKIEQIIMRAQICHLALSLNNIPYVIPLSFGYKDKKIYLHSAKQGKKIDILKQNNQVCFEFVIDHGLIESETGCNWGMKFKSVIGFGKGSFIEDIKKKQKALNIILKNYSDKTFVLPGKNINNTIIIKIDIEQITGKQSGFYE
jgi:nitroimidazol reductase NimA-like FMN-containing flavoprotein (pyridoxamine 5'-phosphate oxidase superfamily)